MKLHDMKFQTLTTLLLIALLTTPSLAQVIKVEVPSSIPQGEYFHLKFIVPSSKATGFTPPSLSSFTILAGPSVSRATSVQMTNGKISSSGTTTYTFVLSPKDPGTYQIGEASASVSGKQIHSKPQTIRVTKGPSGTAPRPSAKHQSPQPDEEIQTIGAPITQRDLSITLTPSRTKVYEQEPILLTYNVHTRLGVALSNVLLTSKPDFTGLIAHEIPIKTIDTHTENRGGTTYRTGTILQQVVFPSQSGTVTIPPVTFSCTVAQRQSHSSDPFEDFFNSGGTVGIEVRRTVPSQQIQVLPLPQPRPATFTGAVGQFTLTLAPPTSPAHARQPMQLTLKIQGSGNLQMLTAPKLPLPDSLKVSQPRQDAQLTTQPTGQTGTLTYTYTILPPSQGTLTLPSVSLTYFDPATEKYQTTATQPITIEIGAPLPSGADKSPEAPGTTAREPRGPATLHLIVLLLLLTLTSVAVYHIHMKIRNKRKKSSYARLRHELRKARHTPTPQLNDIENTLLSFLSEKLTIPADRLTRENIAQELTKIHFPDADTQRLIAALDTLATIRYSAAAPTASTQPVELLHTIATVAEELQKKIIKTTKNQEHKFPAE